MVNINVVKDLDTKKDVLLLGIFSENVDFYKSINPELHSKLEEAIKRKSFSLKKDAYHSFSLNNSVYEKIVVSYLGSKKEFDLERIRRAIYNGIKVAKQNKLKGLTCNVSELCKGLTSDYYLGVAIGETIELSDYDFDNHLSKEKKKAKIGFASILWTGSKDFLKGLKDGKIIGESTCLTRDLVNEPANIVNPEYLENVCKNIAKNNKNVKLRVLNKADLIKKKMGGILAVSNGGGVSPKLIIIEYMGNPKNKDKFALVGKGITFDSGGLNIKPSGYIEDMKIDMGGAGAVIGTLNAVSQLGVKQNIIGVIPTCENMVSGSSYRPGDIIKMYNGMSVEIKNTDAEGRLILADALTFADTDLKANTIVDLATLTGACMVALGYEASGLIGKNKELNTSLLNAGFLSYDRVWELPLFDEFMSQMDNDISDLKNLSSVGNGRMGGAITAGVFLSKFVKDAKWAHIDIAGPAFMEKNRFYVPKYATGAGVRILCYLFLNKK